MTAIEHHANHAAKLRPALALRVLRWIDDLRRALKNRREMQHLSEMPDWQLDDIGLMRSDLVDAYDGRLVSDPTVRLCQAARERARYEYAARNVS